MLTANAILLFRYVDLSFQFKTQTELVATSVDVLAINQARQNQFDTISELLSVREANLA
jgi:hypothetical protein